MQCRLGVLPRFGIYDHNVLCRIDKDIKDTTTGIY